VETKMAALGVLGLLLGSSSKNESRLDLVKNHLAWMVDFTTTSQNQALYGCGATIIAMMSERVATIRQAISSSALFPALVRRLLYFITAANPLLQRGGAHALSCFVEGNEEAIAPVLAKIRGSLRDVAKAFAHVIERKLRDNRP